MWFTALRGIFTGDQELTGDTVLRSQERTGNPHWLWLGAAVVNGLLVSLALVVSLAKLSSAFGSFSSVAAGNYIGAILLPPLLTAAFAAGRAATLMGVGAIGKQPISFPKAAGLASVAYITMAPVLALSFLLAFIPGQFATVVLLLGFTFSVLVAELTLYSLVTRNVPFAATPLLAYAGLTTAWVALCWWIAYLVMSDIAVGGFLGGLL